VIPDIVACIKRFAGYLLGSVTICPTSKVIRSGAWQSISGPGTTGASTWRTLIADDTQSTPTGTLEVIVSAREIIQYLQQHMEYYISTPCGPLLHSIMEVRSKNRMSSYVTKRVEVFKSSYNWKDTTTEFAAKAWKLPQQIQQHAATRTRIIYDKLWHGRNQRKGSKGDDEHLYLCPLCQQPDSQEHLFFDCDHSEIHLCRQLLWASVSEHIQRATDDETLRTFSANILDYIKASPRRGQLIVGLFSSTDIDFVDDQAQRTGRRAKDLKRILLTSYHVITHHLVKLWAARHTVIHAMQRAAKQRERESRTQDINLIRENDTPVPHMYIPSRRSAARRLREPP